MGRIDLLGSFQLSRPIRPTEKEYLDAFVSIPHMKLDVSKLHEVLQGAYGNPLPLRKSKKTVYGTEGEYFVGDVRDYPGAEDAIEDLLAPPATQPTRWCHWYVEGTQIFWNGDESFEKPVEWLRYLFKHFLDPWGIAVDGAVQWYSDTPDDRGTISVWDSFIHIHRDPVDSEADSDSEPESEPELE